MTSNMLYTMKEVASALYVIGPQVGYVAQIGLNHEKIKSRTHLFIVNLHAFNWYAIHKKILYLTTWPQPCSGKLCVPRSQKSRHWYEFMRLHENNWIMKIIYFWSEGKNDHLGLWYWGSFSNFSKCQYSTWFPVSLFHSILIWHVLIWLSLKRDKWMILMG